MDSKIVWVFGSSAAGKDTLMKRLLKSTDTTFLEKFGLRGYHLVDFRISAYDSSDEEYRKVVFPPTDLSLR